MGPSMGLLSSVHTDLFVCGPLLAGLQKCVWDVCCVDLGGFAGPSRGPPCRIFLGNFLTEMRKRESGGKNGEQSGGTNTEVREKSVLPKSWPQKTSKLTELNSELKSILRSKLPKRAQASQVIPDLTLAIPPPSSTLGTSADPKHPKMKKKRLHQNRLHKSHKEVCLGHSFRVFAPCRGFFQSSRVSGSPGDPHETPLIFQLPYMPEGFPTQTSSWTCLGSGRVC